MIASLSSSKEFRPVAELLGYLYSHCRTTATLVAPMECVSQSQFLSFFLFSTIDSRSVGRWSMAKASMKSHDASTSIHFSPQRAYSHTNVKIVCSIKNILLQFFSPIPSPWPVGRWEIVAFDFYVPSFSTFIFLFFSNCME